MLLERGRLFGTNGIRGKTNEDLTPVTCYHIGLAIGTYFSGGRILLGHDGRTSSQLIRDAVKVALMETGNRVYDARMVPTPTLQYSVKSMGFDGGVMVTASHNPPEYNGIKVVASDGVELPRREEEKIERIFFSKAFKLGEVLEEPVFVSGLAEKHVEAILKHMDVELVREKKFKVVVDPGNGVGVMTTPFVARKLGCKTITIHSHVDGRFPGRGPEPVFDSLSDLCKSVKAAGADVGIAHDGDGDRAIFVDERGRIVWGTYSFALIADWFLEKRKTSIVVPVSFSQVIVDVAEKHGAEVVWTPVGSIVVARTMLERGALIGGEENGGVFYAPHHPVRDGAMTAALVLHILAERGKRLGELVDELPKYAFVKDKVACPDEKKKEAMRKVEAELSKKAWRVETVDGVKAWIDEKTWVLVRPSGTEPILRIYVESTSEELAKKVLASEKSRIADLISSA